ncbi:cytokine receptor common subunit gamma-like [Perca flavescens]|uniref:cytokine receptor common subunit gamma-like n=1 Tax=Perca flavescens TaxID=8167 RepID=UPI00106E7162|nr:cytokine receptor common subunit gamma-like [Perca flavescens]
MTLSRTNILFLCATMLKRLLMLLCLTGHVFARETPDVDCLVVHLKYVHCSWNKQGTPEVNYTFYGWFHGANVSECPSYLSENNINTGCNQPYGSLLNRFNDFYTRLVHENQISEVKTHELKEKVKFNPPTNLTVRYGSDSNLWLNWTQIRSNCVESEVRYRNTCVACYLLHFPFAVQNLSYCPQSSRVSIGKQDYCLNLPSRSSLYELQVRSRMAYTFGLSKFWSDWTEPVVWGSNNSTDWFKFPKGLKEGLNYNERPCPVREYCHVRQSDSESSDCSTCSVTTDQTDCSVFIPVNESDLSTPCSSSISQF